MSTFIFRITVIFTRGSFREGEAGKMLGAGTNARRKIGMGGAAARWLCRRRGAGGGKE